MDQVSEQAFAYEVTCRAHLDGAQIDAHAVGVHLEHAAAQDVRADQEPHLQSASDIFGRRLPGTRPYNLCQQSGCASSATHVTQAETRL